jgi:hypothetical protein
VSFLYSYVVVYQKARAARGQLKEAIKDLTKAAELGTIFKRDHETFHQRGLVYFRMVLLSSSFFFCIICSLNLCIYGLPTHFFVTKTEGFWQSCCRFQAFC